jgi:hypothetical protein
MATTRRRSHLLLIMVALTAATCRVRAAPIRRNIVDNLTATLQQQLEAANISEWLWLRRRRALRSALPDMHTHTHTRARAAAAAAAATAAAAAAWRAHRQAMHPSRACHHAHTGLLLVLPGAQPLASMKLAWPNVTASVQRLDTLDSYEDFLAQWHGIYRSHACVSACGQGSNRGAGCCVGRRRRCKCLACAATACAHTQPHALCMRTCRSHHTYTRTQVEQAADTAAAADAATATDADAGAAAAATAAADAAADAAAAGAAGDRPRRAAARKQQPPAACAGRAACRAAAARRGRRAAHTCDQPRRGHHAPPAALAPAELCLQHARGQGRQPDNVCVRWRASAGAQPAAACCCQWARPHTG